jgi:phosphopantothenoylcysteine decarboxylase/phosphopantothenate--cysteine ligase
MSEVVAIIAKAEEMLKASKDLSGVSILITAGGTREAIDPVRFIGNRSSGKMGYAVAKAAVDRGARVTLITAATQLDAPSGCRVIEVETAAQMKEAVMLEAKRADAVVMAAAVADYKPLKTQSSKLKKQSSKLGIKLHKTDDILGILGKNKGKKVLVGFSLETDKLIENSKKKLIDKNLDLVVANGPEAFDGDSSKAHLIYQNGKIENLGKVSKLNTANRILDLVKAKLSIEKDQAPTFKIANRISSASRPVSLNF